MKKTLLFVAALFLATNAIFAQDDTNNPDNRFYQSLEDYANSNPIPGKSILTASFTGSSFQVYNGPGKPKKVKTKDLPSTLFTYKGYSGAMNPYVVRVIEDEPYICLSMGKLCYYSRLSDQNKRYTSDGWNGELKKYKRGDLEDMLKQNGLFEAYKNDHPKREFHDSVNDYFNKTIDWETKYFDLLNEKLRS